MLSLAVKGDKRWGWWRGPAAPTAQTCLGRSSREAHPTRQSRIESICGPDGPCPCSSWSTMADWLASHLVASTSVASLGHQVSPRHCWSTHPFIALPADLYLMLPLSSTSPPRFNSSLPSASPTITAISNTFSSLAGLVGAKTPTESTGSDEAPRQGGPWKGGHFDRLPARWKSSKSETYVPLLPVQGSEIWGMMAIVADRLGVPLRASLEQGPPPPHTRFHLPLRFALFHRHVDQLGPQGGLASLVGLVGRWDRPRGQGRSPTHPNGHRLVSVDRVGSRPFSERFSEDRN